jgi:mRNA-degrading endonuclease toxin of MazEF toxin-antitoxin module
VTRGEIWLVNLDAPMTKKSRAASFRIVVTHGGKTGLIFLDRIRAVDKVSDGEERGNGVTGGT